ncbi:MAG TPA: rod shape-determining protein MreD, partial [Ilumatobacteraceae bacterium]|nr:rod shape-determining protein MreD [Ilumatobacteraceae bacterium]
MLRFLRRPTLRIVPVGLIVMGVQLSWFRTVQPFDTVIQIVLALAAASGIRGGAEKGAWMGFVLGAMFDLGSGATLGQHALAYGLAGFVAGLVSMVAVDPHWWLSMLFVAAGATVGELMVPVINTFLSGSGGWQGGRLATILPVT